MFDIKETLGRYRFSRANFLSVVSVVVVGLIIAHIEIIISRTYAPEILLLQLPGSTAGGSCEAVITTNADTEYTKPLRKLDSVYQYLDSSIFTVTPETGYSLLETGLENYSNDFRIEIECQTTDTSTTVVREFSSGSRHSCFVQQKGRLLVC